MFDFEDTLQSLHLAFMGHMLDPASLASIQKDYNSGYTINDISKSFASHPLSWLEHSHLSGQHLSAIGLVDTAYNVLFDRESDASGLWYWADQILAGSSLKTLAINMISGAQNNDAAFINTAFNSDIQFADLVVRKVYHFFLNKEPDQAGYDYWMRQIESGKTINTFLKDFFAGAETLDAVTLERGRPLDYLTQSNKFGDLNSFINGIYQNLFGRTADSEGLAYWSGQMKISGDYAGTILDIIYNASELDENILKDRVAFAKYAVDILTEAEMSKPSLKVAAHARQLINSISPNAMSVSSAQTSFSDFVEESARHGGTDSGEPNLVISSLAGYEEDYLTYQTYYLQETPRGYTSWSYDDNNGVWATDYDITEGDGYEITIRLENYFGNYDTPYLVWNNGTIILSGEWPSDDPNILDLDIISKGASDWKFNYAPHPFVDVGGFGAAGSQLNYTVKINGGTDIYYEDTEMFYPAIADAMTAMPIGIGPITILRNNNATGSAQHPYL